MNFAARLFADLVFKAAKPIRAPGPAALAARAWALLLECGLPDPMVVDVRPDGALHLIWWWGHCRLNLWVRLGKRSTWELKVSGQRLRQAKRVRFVEWRGGALRLAETGGEVLAADRDRLKGAVALGLSGA